MTAVLLAGFTSFGEAGCVGIVKRRGKPLGDRRNGNGRRAEDTIRTEMMWNILDWETSPAHALMSLAEQGAHFNILCQLYKAGGNLLNDERVWIKASGASCREEWEGVSKMVKAEYIISEDGKWFSHKRVTEQIAKVLDLLDKRREAGKAGGEARAKQMGKQTLPDAEANAKQVPKQTVSPSLTVPYLTKPNQESKAKATPPKSGDVPEWIPRQDWQDFVEMRKKIRAPLTPAAQVIAINTLTKLKAQGHNPAEVLRQSIFKSWRGLFEPEKGNGNGNGNSRSGGSPPPLTDPNCARCNGTGYRQSYSNPGKSVLCECCEAVGNP